MSRIHEEVSTLPGTPKTRLAMARIGIVPEIFEQEAPTLQLQLKLEEDLNRLKLLVLEERESIIANGISKLEFEVLGRPKSLKKYVLDNPEDTARLSEQSIEAPSAVFENLHSEQRNTCSTISSPKFRSHNVLKYSEEHLETVHLQKQLRLERLEQERMEEMRKTIEAEEFAQKIIREKLDLKKEEFLEERAKIEHANARNYEEYQRMQREKVERYEQHLRKENEQEFELRKEEEAKQFIRNELAKERSQRVEERTHMVLEEENKERENRRLIMQRHFEEVEVKLEKIKKEERLRQQEQSRILMENLTKAGEFLRNKEETKREKYLATEEQRFRQVEQRRQSTIEVREEETNSAEAKEFLFQANTVELEREELFKTQKTLEELSRSPCFNYTYIAPPPTQREEKSYSTKEVIAKARELVRNRPIDDILLDSEDAFATSFAARIATIEKTAQATAELRRRTAKQIELI